MLQPLTFSPIPAIITGKTRSYPILLLKEARLDYC